MEQNMEKQNCHKKPSRKTDMSHQSFEEVKRHIDGIRGEEMAI